MDHYSAEQEMSSSVKSIDCIQQHGPWTCAEVEWALSRHLIVLQTVKGLAWTESHPKGEFNLDVLAKQVDVAAFFAEIGTASNPCEVDESSGDAATSMKWLLALLAELYARRDSIADPLGDVEMIYADFDYPECMESFVRYMPVTDGYDPAEHTYEQNIE